MTDREPLTPEGRAELRRLLSEATDGPWEQIGRAIEPVAGGSDVVSCAVDCMNYCYGGTGRGVEEPADAALIVALRNNAEALLDTADLSVWRCEVLKTTRDRANQAEAERDQLRADNDRLSEEMADAYRESVRDRDALQAENDRLGRELTARGRGDLVRKDGGS